MRECVIKPIIGITTYQEQASWRGWHRHASLVPTDFLNAVADAGGTPVLLPPFGAAAEAAAVTAGLDGLLLVGGADIDPARYGTDPSPHTSGVTPERDTWEFALLEVALEEDLAVFGVCRGMQIINVLLGGTLQQHLPDVVQHDNHQSAEPEFRKNLVFLDPCQLPGSVLGEQAVLPCYHHQGVERLGKGVRDTGWSKDGVIESLSLPDRRFVLGMQGHPEVGPDRNLFREFAEAARHRAARPRRRPDGCAVL
ncbi:gamma-glutamyl-gamma-aminobutyrate hydrolase family protein [Streptomyces sp. N2-109]|uniref:Gamma-glutamyl-gamma-aminobutyrate hydrolase family protein n=1 Tax=Streptomyces gossypii TaxID=2883101 RepID=A0ABT2K1P6_9ACTN|nr:gamma-glutamyl-gamma-aminobutyrate hydrolase family protein [Streptomyces gossypii]MCT2594016.1 gamma-glutamyl-gamma-aminobutyrate hydrolase family protein [Streptomyces gossypii]